MTAYYVTSINAGSAVSLSVCDDDDEEENETDKTMVQYPQV